MSLKSRIDRLSREREQTVIFANGLPDREYPGMSQKTHPNIVPYNPQQPGETDAAWTARIEALSRHLFPQASLTFYPCRRSSRSASLCQKDADLHDR